MISAGFTGREKVLFGATAAVVMIAVAYSFVIEPLTEAYSRLNRRIETGLLKLKKSQVLLKQADSINREYEKYASYIKPPASDEEEIASMLKAIEAIARNNNISITNIRPQPVIEKGLYKEFTFEVIAGATIREIMKYMYDLQTSSNLLRVKRLTLTAVPSKNKPLKAILEITKSSIKLLDALQ